MPKLSKEKQSWQPKHLPNLLKHNSKLLLVIQNLSGNLGYTTA